jgi:hypothetical protein
LLSYEEGYELSKVSLQRSIKSDGSNEVVLELAEYFANLIFELVEKPKDEEIPLPKIKNVFINNKIYFF